MLDRVADKAPAASDLFQAHENICACQRARDYALLDALPNLDYAGQIADIFAGLDAAEEQLEHYVITNICSSLQSYAQADPRVLVVAVRIVQRDREEDDWWEDFLAKNAMEKAGELVRPNGRRGYDRSMYNAITKSVEIQFNGSPRDLSVGKTLAWIDKLLAQELESRRFVVPCFPPEYEIGLLLATEYHRGIMGILTDLFQAAQVVEGVSTGVAGDDADSEDSDVVKIVEWYRSYRWGPSGASLGASSLKLPSLQRDRLAVAVTRRSRKKLLTTIEEVLEIDEVSVIWHKEPSRIDAKPRDDGTSLPFSQAPRCADSKPGIATTAGPEKVFGAVGQQIKEARVLGIPALDTEMGHVVTSVLTNYRDAMRELVEKKASEVGTFDENYVCATANNMARCMEYAEELWEAMSPFVEREKRIELEQRFEDLIDGFRESASSAIQRLADLVLNDLQKQTALFFSPRSGTDVMLDVIAVLTSYFTRYETSLVPYHFATFAGACIRFVTYHYLAPFMALGSSRAQKSSSGRSRDSHRLTDERSSHGSPSSSFIGSDSSSTTNVDRGAGLSEMHANAVEAQLKIDVSNLFGFFRSKASLLEKKQIDVLAAAIESVRKLFNCHPSPQSLVAAHEEASSSVAALGALANGLTLRLPIESSEVMWHMRKDVKTTNLLESVARLRRKNVGDLVNEKSLDFDKVAASELRWKP